MAGPEAESRVASPLRWAGGKRWLVPTIRDLVGTTAFSAYHEPFIGGASVFLGLRAFPAAVLGDSNEELIATYKVIRDHPDELAEQVHSLPNEEAIYYAVRASSPTDRVARAARFLYLNHTSFNGIYRVNLNGIYNVPFGRRAAPRLPTVEHLRTVAARLKRAKLRTGDFGDCLRAISSGHLVFLDPPYTVAHNYNGFVKYNQRLFSFEDQIRPSVLIDQIRARGAYYILCNASHRSIAELFDKGDTRFETSRRNNIGGWPRFPRAIFSASWASGRRMV